MALGFRSTHLIGLRFGLRQGERRTRCRPSVVRVPQWSMGTSGPQLGLIWLSIFICWNPALMAQISPPITSNRASYVKLNLRAKAHCPSNVLLLSDLVELSGSDSIVHLIADLPIAPAPRADTNQTWTRESIEKTLALRGLSQDSIHWQGASECVVQRIQGQRSIRPEINSAVQSASYNNNFSNPATSTAMENEKTDQGTSQSLDKSLFTAPFTTPATISQAERIAVEAISNYLQTRTNSTGRWIINCKIPSEHAKVLTQRRQILGVAGGQPPWEGEQEFVFLIKGASGEQSITIAASVKLPEMVVAANRPLAKGYILREEDLVWIPMPKGLPFGPEDCFSAIETLLGQQLRRSMSTQQVIRLAEVGAPTVVHVGDTITVEVVSGGIVVGTSGRAIEAGGMDDVIQVDVEPNRTRVLARITGDRKVEVIANGTRKASANTKKPNSSQTNSRR